MLWTVLDLILELDAAAYFQLLSRVTLLLSFEVAGELKKS